MSLDDKWFSEIFAEAGSAFSLRKRRKLHEEQTTFQRIEIYETEHFGNLMVIDGFVMLTQRDNFIYHEMLAHTSLYAHRAPRNVLIIGGGDCGTLREVLHHAEVEVAHQVEIDERVTRLAEQYFPELCAANDDARAQFYFKDGIKWVADAAPGSYDVIIVDSTDPVGPAQGLFTEPFFRTCYQALSPDGLIIQQSESPLFHLELIDRMRSAMSAAGFADTATLHFPQCVYPSGWWSATVACKTGRALEFREDAARAKPFATRYYNADIHRAAFALPQFVKDRLC